MPGVSISWGARAIPRRPCHIDHRLFICGARRLRLAPRREAGKQLAGRKREQVCNFGSQYRSDSFQQVYADVLATALDATDVARLTFGSIAKCLLREATFDAQAADVSSNKNTSLHQQRKAGLPCV